MRSRRRPGRHSQRFVSKKFRTMLRAVGPAGEGSWRASLGPGGAGRPDFPRGPRGARLTARPPRGHCGPRVRRSGPVSESGLGRVDPAPPCDLRVVPCRTAYPSHVRHGTRRRAQPGGGGGGGGGCGRRSARAGSARPSSPGPAGRDTQPGTAGTLGPAPAHAGVAMGRVGPTQARPRRARRGGGKRAAGRRAGGGNVKERAWMGSSRAAG